MASIERCSSKNNISQALTKPKRRNSEKRKEKSRNAARYRRGKETDIYYELAHELPLPHNICQQLDKAGIMRLCISYLKTRQLIPHTIEAEVCIIEKEKDSEVLLDRLMDDLYLKSLEGFLYVLSQDGDIVYLSENVSKYLGLTQVELIGQSIYEFTHPCDHEEIREQLADRSGVCITTKAREHQNFLVRLKCTLTDKGKTVNLKSAIYKVVQCIGHKEWVDLDKSRASTTRTSSTLCLVVIASPIPHPSNIEHPLDSKTFVSRHNMDMTFTDCDERIEELLGYNTSEVEGHSFYNFFHGADNEVIEKNLKDLYAKGQAVIGRYRFLAKDGGYAWINTEATIIYHNKTNKPQCIVCIHYLISGVEKEEEILSLDQEVANSTKAKDETKKESCDSPFVYWSTSENQTVELDPNELDYLAPTPGEVFLPLFSSTTKEGQMSTGKNECALDYSEMMHGIGDNFMDFNPFAPMDFEMEKENEMSPQVLETDQKSTEVLLNNDPVLATEKYTSSSEDEGLDELGVNAPFIVDEGCQFTNNTLTDLEGICWDSWKSVNPFSLDAMIGPGEQDTRPTVSDSMDFITESPTVNASPTSLGRMAGLSRSMPNMSATMNTGPPTQFPTIPGTIYESVTPLQLETSNQFLPEDYLNIRQMLRDHRDVRPDILQRLPVYRIPQPQISPATSHILPATSQISPATSQISPATSQISPQTSQISPQMSQISPQMSQISPQTSQISPQMSQISPQTSQISPQTSQISPQTSLISPQTAHIIPTASSSSPSASGVMLSLSQILMNLPTRGPDWSQQEIGQQDIGHPSLKLPFGYGTKLSDSRLLKRKLSSDISPMNAKMFGDSTGNRLLMKKESKTTCPKGKQSMSTVNLNAWADMLNQSDLNTTSNTLIHSKLLQQVAMKANESSKNVCNPTRPLFSPTSITNLISSSSLVNSMPLINQYDAEVNAPIMPSSLLQGNDLLRALEQPKDQT